MQVVIARYNEDISWSSHLENRIIYNKGHTFAWHTLQNYDSLADKFVLTQ